MHSFLTELWPWLRNEWSPWNCNRITDSQGAFYWKWVTYVLLHYISVKFHPDTQHFFSYWLAACVTFKFLFNFQVLLLMILNSVLTHSSEFTELYVFFFAMLFFSSAFFSVILCCLYGKDSFWIHLPQISPSCMPWKVSTLRPVALLIVLGSQLWFWSSVYVNRAAAFYSYLNGVD